MLRFFAGAFLLAALALGGAPAQAQKRVALVVGNSAYEHTSKLDNPKNDAIDMTAALKAAGFHVIEGLDLDKAAFERKVRDLSVALRDADVGLFFYAGHGLQVGGANYLVPIDAKAETADALDWEMVRLDLVHRTMERAAATNIIFLDACRNNPLARNLARAMGTRSTEIGRGLAATESGVGTLISFSTQPGNVALDGSGRNSPFAGSLVKRIAASNDDLSALLIDVRNDVRKETQNKQVPWEHSALTGRFYFNLKAGAAPTASKTSEAAEAWAAAKDSSSVAVLQAFLARYSDTFFADLARARIVELEKQQVAAIAPVPATPPPRPANPPQAAGARFLRLASSFPRAMTEIYEPAEQFAKDLSAATSTRFKISVTSAGELVPSLQVMDAVQKGTVELGWTTATYSWDKEPAFAVAAGAGPFGLNAAAFARWLRESGKVPRDQLFSAFGVKAFPCSIWGPRSWHVRKALQTPDDIKGLKMRIGGLASAALVKMGAAPQQLPAGDIYLNLESGKIEAVEWFTPPLDEKLGFHRVAKYYYYPVGEATFSGVTDLVINMKVWNELGPADQQAFENACRLQLSEGFTKLSDGVVPSLQRMVATGTVVARLPDAVAKLYRQATEDVLDERIKSPAGLAVWQSLKKAR